MDSGHSHVASDTSLDWPFFEELPDHFQLQLDSFNQSAFFLRK